mmetsp:Transcript_11503/g.23395  ORF Transcript_11503/g.23395 Transcript_11503/m.23395 type:complete len:116 (-) Transcript_11503:4170-4517(-)
MRFQEGLPLQRSSNHRTWHIAFSPSTEKLDYHVSHSLAPHALQWVTQSVEYKAWEPQIHANPTPHPVLPNPRSGSGTFFFFFFFLVRVVFVTKRISLVESSCVVWKTVSVIDNWR